MGKYVSVEVDVSEVICEADDRELVKELISRGYKVFGKDEEPRRTTYGENLYQDMLLREVQELLNQDRLTIQDFKMLQNPSTQIIANA